MSNYPQLVGTIAAILGLSVVMFGTLFVMTPVRNWKDLVGLIVVCIGGSTFTAGFVGGFLWLCSLISRPLLVPMAIISLVLLLVWGMRAKMREDAKYPPESR